MILQGKGKKRSVGWFPASYVKLMEAKKEEADQEAGEEVAAGQSVVSRGLTIQILILWWRPLADVCFVPVSISVYVFVSGPAF